MYVLFLRNLLPLASVKKTLRMEAASCLKMLGYIYQNTWQHTPEDHSLEKVVGHNRNSFGFIVTKRF
jgi:hypothetical protein